MSILLDALRKSENSQRPVEPPTIHGGDYQPQEPGAIKSSYVILLIMVALVLIGWLLWKQYYAEEVGYRPPVELPAGRAISNVPAEPDINKTESATTSQNEVNVANGRSRTPVETYKVPEAEKDAAREERKAKVAAADAARAKSAAANDQRRSESEKPATAKPKLQPKPKPEALKATAKTATDGSTKKPSAVAAADSGSREKDPNSPTEDYQSPEPQPISYWELPDSVRNGVPEIKFSVLVYAEQPENRFVLINGERLIEGDELKPGLVVKHIRRDGVVFSYQLYQFFVKR